MVLLSIPKQTVRPAQLVLVKDGYDSSDLDNAIDDFEDSWRWQYASFKKTD